MSDPVTNHEKARREDRIVVFVTWLVIVFITIGCYTTLFGYWPWL